MKHVKRSTLPGQAGQLAVYDWPMPLGPIRGTVLLVHGLGEHTGRYDHVADQLRQWGFAVRGYDHQGHGHSEGVRGTLHTQDGLLQDLATVIDDTRARPGTSDAPLILLGHSMGGLVVARAVAEQLRYVDAVIMSSPALGTWANPLQKLLLATLPKYWPHLCVRKPCSATRWTRWCTTASQHDWAPGSTPKAPRRWHWPPIGKCPAC
jgi:alpha-beta hydrolase superfamily lysophospholipase